MVSVAEAVAWAAVLAWTLRPGSAASCTPPSFKTVDAQCRWVLGRPVPCEVPAAPGTKASFSCKPLYRLPLALANLVHPEAGEAGGMETSTCREDGTWAPLPFTCVPECGRIIGKGKPLIVDGKPVYSPVEYPWHVGVYDRKHKKGMLQVCGATLITTKFFVSAAHCFLVPLSNTNEVRLRSPEDFAAAVGKLNRDWSAREDTAQMRNIAQIHTRGYGGPRLNHVRDLALVEMDSAVELTAATLPACVDWGLQERQLQDGDVGAVVGWGGLWKSAPSNILQAAMLPFVSKERCLQQIPSQLLQYVLLNDDRFCAGVHNGTTVAQGDSGGGLAFPNRERRWFLQGVVSVGMPEARTLTAFTNITSFVRWMADKIQDEEIRAAAAEHQVPVEIPKEYTASDLEEEQRAAYFREDIGLSLHHMHWHFHYTYLGPRQVVDKDRRGELLFYMHSQLLARYNGERMTNHLPRVKRLALREPIKEGYYPKLDNLVASRIWPGRPPNTLLQDLNRDGLKIDVEDLERWTARIYEAIAVGSLVNETGGVVALTEDGGANILANTIESSVLSPNRQLYGELMNHGHILISLAHDPENRYLESFGVMGDAGVALRDPVFYRWHTFIWDMMREYKQTLRAYTSRQLSFPDVFVRGVEVHTVGLSSSNELRTHWQASDLELSRGLDFSPRSPVYARLTHLQHEPFSYTIKVENKGPTFKEGSVRIFLGPKNDERGRPMNFNDQRHYMIELDKFTAILQPGVNVLQRRSSQSSVTIPFERTFRNLDANRPTSGRALAEFIFCGCGFPQHLLLPRGTAEGMAYSLFVMVTDYKQDKVEQVLEGSCDNAPSICGVFNGKYPDKRPIGFPLDRAPPPRVTILRDFLTPNMFVQTVTIRFRDVVKPLARNVTVFGHKDNVIKVPRPTILPSVEKRLKEKQRLPLPPITSA